LKTVKSFVIALLLGLGLGGIEAAADNAQDYHSDYLAISFATNAPAFAWFAVDALGQGERLENVILSGKLPAADYTLKREGEGRFAYLQRLTNGEEVAVWQMELSSQRILLRSRYASNALPFRLLINQKVNHATLLGHLAAGKRRVSTPCVLHLPDQGTFRITASVTNAFLDYDAMRRQPENFVRVDFLPATKEQRTVEYKLEVTLIHPELAGLADNPLYDGYRRNFLNLIQLHPRLRTLANNSSSDVCGFCFWQYAELAREAPPLAPGLTVMDLVRQSLERVLNGGLTYGQVGYKRTPEYPNAAPWRSQYDSLDMLPSLVIAGARGCQDKGGRAWAEAHFDRLAGLTRKMLALDKDGNGLIEYPPSGNSGTWDGVQRPANWWDTIGFGHEDAFANALAYHGCRLMSEVATELGKAEEAKEFSEAAQKIKAAYYPTFFNPETGVLAGWKSADGARHDYWFTFINGMAISLGLVEDKQANAIMDALLNKMTQVGFDRFDLGLPGNLIPIRKEDYTEKQARFGAPSREDGSDGFQIYENGAATHCHAYWTVKALYKLGRVADARRIYYPMLSSFRDGGFQGFGSNGMSKDWRNWKGECNGYEGYLSDGYLALLAVRDDLQAGKGTKAK